MTTLSHLPGMIKWNEYAATPGKKNMMYNITQKHSFEEPPQKLRSCMKQKSSSSSLSLSSSLSSSSLLSLNTDDISGDYEQQYQKLIQKQKQKQKRSVTFNRTVICRRILHVNDYSDDEYNRCFLSETDYIVIREMFLITQQFLLLGEDEDEETGICYRGVEEQMEEETQCRNERIKNLRNIVFSEQKHRLLFHSKNKNNNNTDTDYMAYLCRAETIRSKQKALSNAKKDQEDAFSW